jgi:DNA polymerase-3 subunit alpha
MILSGVFDCIHPNRNALMQGMESIIKAAVQKNNDQQSGQVDLFGAVTASTSNEMPIPLPNIAEFEDNERLFNERNMLGHFMTGHPIASVKQWFETVTSHSIKKVLDLKPDEEPKSKEEDDFAKKRWFNGTEVLVGGLITSVRVRNENSANLVIVDETSQIEATFFKETFFENEEKMKKDEIVIIEGEAGVDNFSGKFIIRAKHILTLNEAIATYCTKIGFITSTIDYQQFSNQLKELLQTHGRGKARIYIHHEQEGIVSNLKLGDNFKIRPSHNLILEALKQTNIDKVLLK